MINKALNLDCPDPAETYSTSPHFYTELGIPADAGGSVGSARKAHGARRPKDESRISSTDKADRPARSRSRRRTRGGENAGAHTENASTPTVSDDAAASEGGRPRRRRRRGPRKAAEAAPSN